MDQENNSSDELQEFEKLKKEVSALRAKLNPIYKNKEDAFAKMLDVHKEIKQRIETLKKLKEERDSLTNEVKKLKDERNKLNEEVKEKGQELKGIEQEKLKAGKDFERSDPSIIESEIERLEQKVETEVIPFTQEQQIRKKIKELKNKKDKLSRLGLIWKDIKTTSRDFFKTRKKAMSSHHDVQEKAQLSQDKHEAMNKVYEELKKLRDEERPFSQQHKQFKEEYHQVKSEIAEKQKKLDQLSGVFKDISNKRYSDKIKAKTEEVEEKLKKRKKLRTEDILAFQAKEE